MISTDKKVFIDTNILVYANDSANRQKQQIARDIIITAIKEENGYLSAQALGEFYVTVTRKIATPLPADTALRQIELLGALEVLDIDYASVLQAVQLSQRYDLSYWDAQIIATASKAGCDILCTEDLNHSQVIEKLEVVNPFL
jgi:predicted nucleic acid-binding protein